MKGGQLVAQHVGGVLLVYFPLHENIEAAQEIVRLGCSMILVFFFSFFLIFLFELNLLLPIRLLWGSLILLWYKIPTEEYGGITSSESIYFGPPESLLNFYFGCRLIAGAPTRSASLSILDRLDAFRDRNR